MISPSQILHETPAAPVRVCFVIDRLSRAGTESQLLLLLQQIDRTQVEPFLCLLDGFDETSKELLPADCPILKLGVRRLKSFHALRQAFHFMSFLKTNHIDVVQTYFPDSTRFAAPIAKVAGVRAVFGSRRNVGHWMTKHDARIAGFYNRFFIDKVVANCEAARQSVIEQEGMAPERVIVLPNGIDLSRFEDAEPLQPKPAGHPRRVGMVGNLREVKGPDLFIQAAGLVIKKFPDVYFEIAGGGDPAPYRALIDELGITNNVRFCGPVLDVPAFLATLDVAVLPSRAEGLSNALLEYMAAGRPIVATNVGGNGELIQDGINGKLVDASGDALASGIEFLLNHFQIGSDFGLLCTRQVSEFSTNVLVKKLQSLYAQTADFHEASDSNKGMAAKKQD